MKKIFILFIFSASILLSACSNKEEKTTKAETNTTKSEKNMAKTEDNTTKAEDINKVEILNNGKLPSDEEIKSVAIRDGNTGKIIFEAKENETVNNIVQKLWQINFTEYDDPQSSGWRYDLLINNDEMHITISGNDLIRINKYGNSIKSVCCRTDFDIIGYIENELLGVK